MEFSNSLPTNTTNGATDRRKTVPLEHSQEKIPNQAEIDRLRQDFKAQRRDRFKTEALLRTARDLHSGRPIRLTSEEYWTIQRRVQAGEPLAKIVENTAANLRHCQEATLDRELAYRQAEAGLLQHEVATPVTDRDLIQTIDALERHATITTNSSAFTEINRRQQAGETLAEIKAKAQQSLGKAVKTERLLRLAQAVQDPRRTRPLDLDLDASLRERIGKGETLDQIINQTQAKLLVLSETGRKKQLLAQTLARIREIKNEKQALNRQDQAKTRPPAETAAAVLKYPDLESYLLLEFGIDRRQISLLPEFSSVAPGETAEARQIRITRNIFEILRRKGALATVQENRRHFKTHFNLPDYSLTPEAAYQCPAGGTFYDPESGTIKVYLNPGLSIFKADYQLIGILEEAIHYSQLAQSGRTEVTGADELQAKDKIIELAPFLGLSPERIDYLWKVREAVLSRFRNQ